MTTTPTDGLEQLLEQVGAELEAVPWGAAHPSMLVAVHLLRDAVALLAKEKRDAD